MSHSTQFDPESEHDEQQRFERLCDRIASALERAGITEADLLATLPEARRRVAARRYPELLRPEQDARPGSL